MPGGENHAALFGVAAVNKRPKKNMAASFRQRLLNKARKSGRPFNELLQYFAMERFLYRLSKSSYRKHLILKGALMFAVWEAPTSRPTKDIDLLGRIDNNVDVIVAAIRNICLEDVEPDGIVFDASSVEGERITEWANYEGVRVRFRGKLGTARITMQLDIGFGDVVVPSTVVTDYPTILHLSAPRLQCYSKESLIAEKFETMARLGPLNSRMKDFFDIWFLSRRFRFDGQTLARAIAKTFSQRGTEIPPQPLSLMSALSESPAKQSQWRGFARRNRLEEVPGDLSEVTASIVTFLGPIAEALTTGKPFKGIWNAPGPWSYSQTEGK